MKLSLDVVRDVLTRCEENAGALFDLGSDQWSDVERYHIEKMDDAGLVRIYNHPRRNENPIRGLASRSGAGATKFELTWQGHEYLNLVRNDGVWAKTKEVVAKEGGNVALELVKALALGFAKKQIEDRTGMKL